MRKSVETLTTAAEASLVPLGHLFQLGGGTRPGRFTSRRPGPFPHKHDGPAVSCSGAVYERYVFGTAKN
jgi:hypothetical protein